MATDWQSRRDGFEHRRGKPTDRPINWKYWGSLQDWTQWDAFALSLNLNPENLEKSPNSWMAGPGRGPTFLSKSFPSRAVELEFQRRLTMFGRVIGGRPLATVSPAQFAAWCLNVGLEGLPPELVAMAATEPQAAPVATPEPPAAPVVLKPVQRQAAQAAAVLDAIRAMGHNPLALPERKPGKRGVKADVRDALSNNPLFGGTVFEKTWERLRAGDEIAERP